MDKKEIQDRVQMITAEMVQTKANYAKLEGHLAEANHWLMEHIKKETEAQVQADKESLNGEANIEGESQVTEQGLCPSEGEEVPDSGQESSSECESESPATV